MRLSKLYPNWLTWQRSRAARAIGLAGITLFLLIIVGVLGIKFGLFWPRFDLFLGSVAEINAPCPPNMQIYCGAYEDWQYFDIWLTTGEFDFFPDGGLSITNASYWRLIRIKIETKKGVEGMDIK